MRVLHCFTFGKALGLAGVAAILGTGLLSVQSAKAGSVDWAYWSSMYVQGTVTGVATATITPSVSVIYSGEVESVRIDYPSWTPTTSYAGGTVGNAPPALGNIVQLYGGLNTTDTVTFSTPVVNPVMAIWSLGAGGHPAEFDFPTNEAPTIEAGGLSAEYGGGSIYLVPTMPLDVGGQEGNGTIQFTGTFSSLSWTNPLSEDWYGFTVGTQVGVGSSAPVPLPGSFQVGSVLLLGLLAWRGIKSFNRARQPA